MLWQAAKDAVDEGSRSLAKASDFPGEEGSGFSDGSDEDTCDEDGGRALTMTTGRRMMMTKMRTVTVGNARGRLILLLVELLEQ